MRSDGVKIVTRTSVRRFRIDDVRPAVAFARTVSTLLIRPETRRKVLAAAAAGMAPLGYLEIVGLRSPIEAGTYTLYLRREGVDGYDTEIGEIAFGAAVSRPRCSRQVRLKPEALLKVLAASGPAILACWRPCHGVTGLYQPLACLDLRLLLEG